jgi:hypothetical protein
MMPEEIKPQDGAASEKPQPEKTAVDPTKSTAVDSGDGKDTKTFDASYVKELRDEAAGWRKQFRELEKRLTEFDAEKNKKVEADLADNQKWKELADKRDKELADLKASLDAERLTNLRNKVGIEFKLSPSQIKRLQGGTEDELRADAEELVKDLGLDKPQPAADPKAATPAAPATTPQSRRQTTAVAPDGQPQGETDEQRRSRLYKRGAVNSPLFKSAQ